MSQQPPLKADLCLNVHPQALTRMRAVFRRDVDTICALRHIDGRGLLYMLLTYINRRNPQLNRRNPEQL